MVRICVQYKVSRVFANGLGDLGSIPGHVIPKTFKMVLDTSLLNTQQYKVRIEGKVEQSRERNSALHFSVVASEKGAFWSPPTTVANLHRDKVWHRKMRHAINEEWETTNNGRNKTTKLRKNQKERRKLISTWEYCEHSWNGRRKNF